MWNTNNPKPAVVANIMAVKNIVPFLRFFYRNKLVVLLDEERIVSYDIVSYMKILMFYQLDEFVKRIAKFYKMLAKSMYLLPLTFERLNEASANKIIRKDQIARLIRGYSFVYTNSKNTSSFYVTFVIRNLNLFCVILKN